MNHDQLIQRSRLLHIGEYEAGPQTLSNQMQRMPNGFEGEGGTIDRQEDFHGGSNPGWGIAKGLADLSTSARPRGPDRSIAAQTAQ
jgi:hypothetical protein